MLWGIFARGIYDWLYWYCYINKVGSIMTLQGKNIKLISLIWSFSKPLLFQNFMSTQYFKVQHGISASIVIALLIPLSLMDHLGNFLNINQRELQVRAELESSCKRKHTHKHTYTSHTHTLTLVTCFAVTALTTFLHELVLMLKCVLGFILISFFLTFCHKCLVLCFFLKNKYNFFS